LKKDYVEVLSVKLGGTQSNS